MAHWAAYDYDAQRWITGEPARLLLIAQVKETLACLTDAQAEAYLALTRRVGEPVITVTQARAVAEAELATLKGRPPYKVVR